ncbi:A24 family peptidase [Streptomyces sp. H51]|uniref:A24 family peptidase n=1 Tax=Streptomyces sp. H51 TaxID=3111770 RepID=UPI002D77C0C2|nr:A24 family peptidase [Streptomyces sp. H51]
MRVLLIVAATLWGAGTGLVLPRAAHRFSVEPDEPWNSRCPAGHPITGAYGGWLGRATCPTLEPNGPCGAYGPHTPTTSTATALVCAALATASGPRPETAVWLLLTPVAILLALIDIRVHRLPDVLTLPLAATTTLLLAVAALLPAAAGSWPTALLGGLALCAAYFVLFLANPSGMGFGDVKLALPLGTALGWYGWPTLLTGALTGLLYGALYGATMLATHRATRKSSIPLGPFMLTGTLTGLMLGGIAAAS